MNPAGVKKPLLILSLLLLLLSFTVGCVVVEDSPAPGCVKYWGIPPIGGCSGKSAVINLTVEPTIDCLQIEVNNCNGGVLDVSNHCNETFVLGRVEIGPQEYAVLDVLGEEDGDYLLTKIDSNFSNHIPQENETIELTGTLGDQEVQVQYIKTKELC